MKNSTEVKTNNKDLLAQVRKAAVSIKKLTYVNDAILETLKTNRKKVLQNEIEELNKLISQI